MANSNEANNERSLLPRWVVLSAIVSFVIMAVFSLIASDNPDGLERTIEQISAEGTESGLISFGDTFSSDLLTLAVGMIGAFVLLIVIPLILKRLKRAS